MRYQTSAPAYARLTPVGGGYAFESTYDSALVTALKTQIPAEARQWDNTKKAWLVDARYVRVCAELASAYLGVDIDIPKQAATVQTQTRLTKLEYLGRTKARDNGDPSAFGYADGAWSLIFPESVLREWFDAVEQRPGERRTLYAVLSIKGTATTDEIRSAYRRLTRQWHPDICHEPDAAQQFKTIQAAYEILSDATKRGKYDAGLAFEQSARTAIHDPYPNSPFVGSGYNAAADGYRSPLRCGWVLVAGKQSLARFVVEKIIEWQDIVRADGRTMVTSWPAGAKEFQVRWA